MALVLVVDDSEDLLQLYEEILSLSQHRVVTATSATRGLELVRSLRPDVVLLDMMMPEMDGLGFLARLPAESQGAGPAVIANSGFDGYRDEALRRGACAFLRKPVSIDDLLQSIESALASASVSEALLARNEESVRASREHACREVAAMMLALDHRGVTSFSPRLQPLVEWMSRYYGFGRALVTSLRGSELCVEAAAGDGAPPVGKRVPRNSRFCEEVVDAGSTLYLTEPSRHPTFHFSHHPHTSQMGDRFYMGAPVTAPRRKVVLGTLCLVDTQTREMHCEDMRLMEYLALGVGRAVESLVDGGGGAPDVDRGGVVERALMELLVEVAAQRQARIGGEVRIARAEHEQPLGSACETAYRVSRGLRFAVTQLRPGVVALLHDGPDVDVVRRTMESVLVSIGPVLRRNEVAWRPDGAAALEPLPAERARAIREDMLRRADADR